MSRILVSQLNPIVGDLSGNRQKVIQALDHARQKKCDLVVFPEMVLCGYPPEDLLLERTFVDQVEDSLKKVMAHTHGLSAVIGLVRHNRSKGEKPLFNSAAIVQDGRLVGYQDKRLLPTYDVFDERRYFEPGKGVRLFEMKGKKVGVLICEDIWQHLGHYAENPVGELREFHPDLLLNLAASPYDFGKPLFRASVCAASANGLKCPVILCCQVGGNDELVFDGYSLYLDKEGRVCQVAKGFEEDEMMIDFGMMPHPIPFAPDPLEDLYNALVLGVRDYFHKQGFKKACIGLSGGIDSALVACIASEALGAKNVLGVAMPSRYNSPESLTDAKVLANHLGIESMEISIEGPFASYLSLLSPYFKGKGADSTEENLQARIRGMILMALSNKLGYIVLSTGNKSELAVGYCTLYGDLCGGLGVIADLTKQQVYALSNWINRKKEIIPLSTIKKIPSAELKANQRDSDTLPEYPVLDAIVQGHIEEFLSAEEIASKHQFPIALVKEIIQKIHHAEYKRRQSPPAIRVTKRAFRAGRHFPIVQRWIDSR